MLEASRVSPCEADGGHPAALAESTAVAAAATLPSSCREEIGMPKLVRLTGLRSGDINPAVQEIRFVLAVGNARPMSFVAKFGVLSHIVSGLARMLMELEKVMRSSGQTTPSAAEEVTASHIQLDQMSGAILMRLTTVNGIPYTFALPRQGAAQIAEQLQSESARKNPAGHA